MPVLCITEEIDVHGNALQWALGELGTRVDIWSIADFPDQSHTSIRIPAAGGKSRVTIQGLSAPETYLSIWNRRPSRPERLPSGLAQEDRSMSLYEAHLFVENLKPVVSPGAVWINPFETRRLQLSKALQLELAAEVGFRIPETLMSNNYDDVRAFVSEHSGNVIYKSFHQAAWRNQATETDYRIFTTRVSEEDLAEPVSITACPGTYQQLIPKASELRVTFFGKTYYAMRIFSQESARGQLDWRSDVSRESPTESAVLPDSVLEKCQLLAAKMGLLHGSMDLIESTDGSLVFLEVNEMGQFLWLEDYHPELPLLACAAAFSLEPSPEFQIAANKLPPVSMEAYRLSSSFQEWLKIWDAYVEKKSYPLNYFE